MVPFCIINTAVITRPSLLKGGGTWRKACNNFPLDLEFSSCKLFASEISILLLSYVFPIPMFEMFNLKFWTKGESYEKNYYCVFGFVTFWMPSCS